MKTLIDLYSETFLVFYAGLIGFLSGLAVKRVRGFRRFQDILLAVAINAGFALLFSAYKYGGFDFYYINQVMIWSSMFLVAVMIAFATLVRPRQVVEGQASADTKVVNSTQPNTKILTDAQKTFLLSPLGRSLLGVTVGVILGIIYGIDYGKIFGITYDFGYAYTTLVAPHGILLITCGLAGLVMYPHKVSITLLIIGFFVAGLWGTDYIHNFVVLGGMFGLPAGALLSRILYWLREFYIG